VVRAFCCAWEVLEPLERTLRWNRLSDVPQGFFRARVNDDSRGLDGGAARKTRRYAFVQEAPERVTTTALEIVSLLRTTLLCACYKVHNSPDNLFQNRLFRNATAPSDLFPASTYGDML